MKKYRLKQWYPSLDVSIGVGGIIELTGAVESFYGGIKYEFLHKTGDYCDVGFIQECEFNNPDFWELIEEKKPLKFITEDGVSIYGDMKTYAVAKRDLDIDNPEIYGGNSASFKYFYHKENALAYIEKNKEKKPLFTTDDGVEIFEGDEYIAIGINYDFGKVDTVAHDQVYSGDVMRFKYESNADDYILWNKPLLSLNDIDETIEMYTHEFEELIKLAKERI